MSIVRLLTALAIALSFVAPAKASPLPDPPENVRFRAQALNTKEISEYLSPTASSLAGSLIAERRCPESGRHLSLHQNRRSSHGTRLILVPCFAYGTESANYDYLEYPLTLIVDGDKVRELKLRPFGFMYDSGRIKFITDQDNNGRPELWLEGTVYECGPEDGKGCESEGSSVHELRDGRLEPWTHH